MVLIVIRKQLIWILNCFILILLFQGGFRFALDRRIAHKVVMSENEICPLIQSIFHLRNQALLENNLPALTSLYNRETRAGRWAYEYQVNKMRYLHNWCAKQGIVMSAIKSLVRLRRFRYTHLTLRVILLVSTEYCYSYSDEPSKNNLMRIGTYHVLDLIPKGEKWVINREWYTDPFADVLETGEQISNDQAFIMSQLPRDFTNINPRRVKALAYADMYCGAAANDELGLKYNPKYKNYNYSGGDCANFVSQVLHEGAGFPKTSTWNYGRDGSRAWTNAHAFNRFMLESGRASRIAVGTYSQVLKDSYRLLPGDYIAYEKKGRVTHVSLVTGADSKGYTLTNSHNADRYRVPWDLGYGGRKVRFHLVRVHY